MSSPKREMLGGWVEDLGFTAKDLELEDTAWAWGAVVTPAEGKRPRVLVAERNEGHLLVQHSTSVSKDHLATLQALADPTRATFLADLHLRLFSLPVEVNVTGDPLGADGGEARMRITLATRLVDERLTLGSFYTAYKAVRNAGAVVNLMFSKLAARGEWP